MSEFDGEGVPYAVLFEVKTLPKESKDKYIPGNNIFTAPVTGTYVFTNGSITLFKEVNEGDSIKISDIAEEIKNENTKNSKKYN